MTDEWAQATTKCIAGQIKALRDSRSVQWLEDRTAELGSKVSRSTISELETGRRKTITLTDVIVLAAALEVSVADLLYPGNSDVEALPGKRVPRAEALEALVGARGVTTTLETTQKRIDEIVGAINERTSELELLLNVAKAEQKNVRSIADIVDKLDLRVTSQNIGAAEHDTKATDGR
jgi:hypothetical protein